MSGVAALSVDFTQVIAGTGVGVAGVDDFFNGVLKGTGSCGKRKDISDYIRAGSERCGRGLTH